MRLWRIELLKEQLKQGPLGQRGSVGYILATMLLYTLAVVAARPLNDGHPITGIDWLMSGLTIVLVGGGTYATYRANGGPRGLDFAARYFALGWVIFVRLAVLLFLPAVVLVYIAGAALGAFQLEQGQMDRAFSWAGAAVGITFEVTYYSRLVHHLRTLATYPECVT